MPADRPSLIKTPGLERWLRLRRAILAFKDLERGSGLHRSLLDAGVDPDALSAYLDEPRPRRRKLGRSSDPARAVDFLLASGGVLAGGSAVRMWRRAGPPRDFDVFFPDLPSFVQAFFDARSCPSVDVCLFESSPVEGFDLDACKVSFDGTEFFPHPDAVRAFDTGLCGIDSSAIFHPVSTLRRVVKYSREYGLRFRQEQVASLVAGHGVHDPALIAAAMACSDPS